MKCIDFLKQGDKTSKILGIMSFVLISISTFGYLMMFCDAAKNLSDVKKNANEIPEGEENQWIKDYYGVVGTTCALAIASFVAWLVWIILYNFGIADSICSIVYYIAFIASILLLVFNIAIWIFTPRFEASYANEIFKAYPNILHKLFYMLLVGVISSFMLKSSE